MAPGTPQQPDHPERSSEQSAESVKPKHNPETKRGLTRRQLMYAAAVAALMGITAEELIRNGWVQFGHDHDGDHGNEHAELDPAVIERLRSNAEALRAMERRNPVDVLNQQQAIEGQKILVPKPRNYKKICCIDERYKQEGTGEGHAGVGVLMTPEQLQTYVSEEVDEIEAAFAAGEQEYIFEICPHGAGKCGAAKLARSNAHEQDMSPAAIDATALQGANRSKQALEAEIARRPALAGKRININVRMLPEEHFLQSHNHPGAVALHHVHDDMVYNLDRDTGALMYNIKDVEDGILAAKIALGDHGMEHGERTIPLPANLRFRIVITGPANRTGALVAAYQRKLAEPGNAGIRNRVSFVIWNVQAQNAAVQQELRKAA